MTKKEFLKSISIVRSRIKRYKGELHSGGFTCHHFLYHCHADGNIRQKINRLYVDLFELEKYGFWCKNKRNDSVELSSSETYNRRLFAVDFFAEYVIDNKLYKDL